jgi:hypothetical protein
VSPNNASANLSRDKKPLQTKDFDMVEKQTDAAQVEPIVSLQSAEWYAMRFGELLAWLKEAEAAANERQEKYEEEGKTHLASRSDGFAGCCIRTRRWIDHYVLKSN